MLKGRLNMKRHSVKYQAEIIKNLRMKLTAMTSLWFSIFLQVKVLFSRLVQVRVNAKLIST